MCCLFRIYYWHSRSRSRPNLPRKMFYLCWGEYNAFSIYFCWAPTAEVAALTESALGQLMYDLLIMLMGLCDQLKQNFKIFPQWTVLGSGFVLLGIDKLAAIPDQFGLFVAFSVVFREFSHNILIWCNPHFTPRALPKKDTLTTLISNPCVCDFLSPSQCAHSHTTTPHSTFVIMPLLTKSPQLTGPFYRS